MAPVSRTLSSSWLMAIFYIWLPLELEAAEDLVWWALLFHQHSADHSEVQEDAALHSGLGVLHTSPVLLRD